MPKCGCEKSVKFLPIRATSPFYFPHKPKTTSFVLSPTTSLAFAFNPHHRDSPLPPRLTPTTVTLRRRLLQPFNHSRLTPNTSTLRSSSAAASSYTSTTATHPNTSTRRSSSASASFNPTTATLGLPLCSSHSADSLSPPLLRRSLRV